MARALDNLVVARQLKAEPSSPDEINTLLKRAGADRAGNTLVVTLLSSDVGKLYAALKQSTENLR